MSEDKISPLEEFNKGVEEGINFAERKIKIVENTGIATPDDINEARPTEIIYSVFDQILGFIIGRPAEVVTEKSVAILTDLEAVIQEELESIETGREAVEYARKTIMNSRLRKAGKKIGVNAIDYTANAIDYTANAIEATTKSAEEAGTAVAVYTVSNSTSVAKQALDTVTTTAVGALEMVKNIPRKISEYAVNA